MTVKNTNGEQKTKEEYLMSISVKEFMNFLKKTKNDYFLREAFFKLVQSANDMSEIDRLSEAIYYLEIYTDKKAKEEFYKKVMEK